MRLVGGVVLKLGDVGGSVCDSDQVTVGIVAVGDFLTQGIDEAGDPVLGIALKGDRCSSIAGDSGIGESQGVAIGVGDRHQVTCSATDFVANALLSSEGMGAP